MSYLSSLRLRTAAIAAAVLLPTTAHAQQVFIEQQAPLFAGPDAGYPVIAELYPGLAVELMGCLAGYRWCDVMLPDGQRGWIYGDSLSYPWMGSVLPIPQYGPTLGIPLITFVIGDYWGRHYRHQPWYGERRWRHAPPPAPRVAPPMPVPAPSPWGGGWQSPYPPHAYPPHERAPEPPRRERERDGGRERGHEWERHREPALPPRDEAWRGNPPPRHEPPPNRGGHVAPAPSPQPGTSQPFPPRPADQGRPFPPHQERIEAPRPQREIALPPGRERESGHGGPGNRPEGPRREP